MNKRLLNSLVAAMSLVIIVALLLSGIAWMRRTSESALRIWSPNVPISSEALAALQSEPAIGVSGNTTFLAWTDSRNSVPDIYTNVTTNDTRASDKRVTNSTPNMHLEAGFHPSLVVEPSGRAFVVYAETQRIMMARYDIASSRWVSRTMVNASDQWEHVARYPSIGSDGNGNLVVVWEDFRNAGENVGPDIFVNRCNGNTMTCNASAVKSNNDAGGATQRRPRLSMSGNSVVVVWEDGRERGESPRVYGTFSTNGGATWSANARVNKDVPSGGLDVNSRDAATNPVVAFAADGSAFAAWEFHAGSLTASADIYAARWDGSTWSLPQRVDTAPKYLKASHPTIAASSAGVFIGWTDSRNGTNNPDIFFAKWNGTGWDEGIVVNQSSPQSLPSLHANGSQVHIAWQDERNGSHDVFTASWSGSGWSAGQLSHETTNRAAFQMFPELAGNYAVYLDRSDGFEQYRVSRLLPGGTPVWQYATTLPTQAKQGSDVSVGQVGIASSGALHAVWSEAIWPKGSQIYFSSYTGQWAEPISLTGLNNDSIWRDEPAIAARDEMIAVAWVQRQNEQHQIFAAWFNNGAWSQPTAVTSAPKPMWEVRPSITIDTSKQMHIAWGDPSGNGRTRVMVASRGVSSASWTTQQVSVDTNVDWCEQKHPQIEADNVGKLHVVWSGCAFRNPPNNWPRDSFIFYSSSSNGGASWSSPLKVGATGSPTDSNDTSSRPALSANGGEIMALYPSATSGTFKFYAVTINNGVASSPTLISDGETNWARPDNYDGEWHEGDSRGAITFDASQFRHIIAFPDRRNERAPRIYSAIYGDTDLVLRNVFLPLVRR
jgi:hypothetical protein